MDRRGADRCPECQGPTKTADGELRCRNSLCRFNHEKIACPRCAAVGTADAQGYQEGVFSYKCRDCMKQWTASA